MSQPRDYTAAVKGCLDVLLEHGTDHYGQRQTPLLVSILDVETLLCPAQPAPLDEYYRVTRRGRRNPGGSNLMGDQPLLRAMYRLSDTGGDPRYAEFARRYSRFVMTKLVDDHGFFWWGWHRHYDVHQDLRDGHNDNPHELHTLFEIDWERLWALEPAAVTREIEAIWQWHVIDKKTGEVNRHGDGHRGCDFSMAAGAYLQAFAFLYAKTKERQWLDRTRLLADYYWQRRNPQTNLFPERPNAGADRFDGSTFTTSITGLHCYSLLRAWQLTGDTAFRDYALAYLAAYAKFGFDAQTGQFWAALRLDGTPITEPRVFTDDIDSSEGYLAAQPRGHLDLWQPYLAGYEHPIHTAQVYAYAYQLTKQPELLVTARQFADWMSRTPPGSASEHPTAWYRAYSSGAGRQGTYADQYGRAISFYLSLAVITGEAKYLAQARALADVAVAKLRLANGLFRGHPAKPYYEAMDGVGYLLVALLQLAELEKNPAALKAEALANW